MANSKIEWTNKSWNPVTGCSKISEGCRHCYAEVMARRLKAMGQNKYHNGFQVMTHEECLKEPLSWNKPQMILFALWETYFMRKFLISLSIR